MNRQKFTPYWPASAGLARESGETPLPPWAGSITGLAVALSWAVIELVMRIGLTELVADRLQALQPWILGVGAEWAGLAGFCWSVVSRLCWNQRSSRLLEMADSPESNPALHRRGFLAGTLPGWGYFFTIAIATPTLLFYAIENARGAWAWNRMQARLKADGVCYELGCNVPPPASDNENFFATPFWSNFAYRLVPVTNGLGTHPVIRPPYWMLTTNGELASHVWATNPFRKQIYLPPVKPPHLVPTEPRYAGIHGPIDLAKWATAFREAAAASASTSNGFFYRPFPVTPIPGEPADDVLLALTLYDDQMAEFASAAARPRNRYPAHYEELSQSTPLAYLSSIRTAVEICQLRAIAHLAKGNTEAATTNSVLGFRLAESLNEETLSVYRIAQNRYPKTLEELVPTYLIAVPADWMGGNPFHYQPTDDGWFRLWSVGPNGIDDGGVLRKAKGNGGFENQELDWPWPSRAKTSEALLF